MINCELDFTTVECMIKHLKSRDATNVNGLVIGLLIARQIMVLHVLSVDQKAMSLENAQILELKCEIIVLELVLSIVTLHILLTHLHALVSVTIGHHQIHLLVKQHLTSLIMVKNFSLKQHQEIALQLLLIQLLILAIINQPQH